MVPVTVYFFRLSGPNGRVSKRSILNEQVKSARYG